MVPWVGRHGVIVVFPDHTYVLFVFSSTTTLYISSLKWVPFRPFRANNE